MEVKTVYRGKIVPKWNFVSSETSPTGNKGTGAKKDGEKKKLPVLLFPFCLVARLAAIPQRDEWKYCASRSRHPSTGFV